MKPARGLSRTPQPPTPGVPPKPGVPRPENEAAGRPAGADSRSGLPGPCIAVVGPTGSGKSELAIRLAERLGGEILNTDSLQVYRYLDIGTAKPEPAERARVPHHLLDLTDPDHPFSAGDYVRAARSVLAELAVRRRVPVLCGGTGLYFRALVQGISDIPAVPAAVRRRVAEQLEAEGAPALHARLAQVDPATARRIHPRDRQRVARALEVFAASGRPLSAYQAAQPFAATAPAVLSVGFGWERSELYRRLDRRVESMMERGLIDEVRSVLARGFKPEVKPLRSIGYLEAVEYVLGRRSLADVVPAVQLRTRHYAKRQITWFKRHPDVRWAAPGDFAAVERWAEKWLLEVPPLPGPDGDG